MSESPRRLAACLLLTAAGLAACSSPDATNATPSIVASPSSGVVVSGPPASPTAEPTSTVTFAQDPPPPSTSAPTALAQPLPLTLSRTGGIAGVQDQVKIDTNGTATVTHRAGKPATSTLSATELTALRRLLTDPALVREAKAADPAGPKCADGFQYDLRTPELSVKTTDCGRSARPTLTKVISLVLPPGGK